MVHEIDLTGNVPSYGQIQCCYCGAASAQMIMDGYPDPNDRLWVDQGPPNNPNCWDTIQANNSTDPTDVAEGWCTDPLGLRNCLRTLNPPPSGTWNIYSDDRDTVIFNILYWMNRNSYPVATLINEGGHWVVIVGYETDIEPIRDSTPTLQEITFNDPEPHNVGSIITKTGNQWYNDEWDGTIIYPGTWHDTYVAVIEPPVKGTVKVERVTRVGRKLISPEDASKAALKWIEELNLSERPHYRILLRKDMRPLEPILVREKKKDVRTKKEFNTPYYYLVRFGLKKETGACDAPLSRIGVIVNAYTGNFEEIGAFSKPVQFLPKKGAIRVAAKALNLADKEIESLLKEDAISASMMYQASEITHIRIYPFWEVTIKEKTLYVDQLGKLYGSIVSSRPGD